MSSFLHPGVYVLEVPGGARSIEGVPTGITIFVGETEFGPTTPTKIRSRGEYERWFGGYLRSRGSNAATRLLMPYALDGYFANGGGTAYVLRVIEGDAKPAACDIDVKADPAPGPAPDPAPAPVNEKLVVASSPGSWANGSLKIAVVESLDKDVNHFRVVVFYRSPTDGVERLVETFDRLSLAPDDENYVVSVLRRSRFIRWNEAELKTPKTPANSAALNEKGLSQIAVAMAGGTGGDGDLVGDYGNQLNKLAGIDDAALLVAAHDRMLSGASALNDTEHVALTNLFIDYCNRRPALDLFFIGDLPRLTSVADPVSAAVALVTTNSTLSTATTFNALYWPHVRIADPVGLGSNATLVVPPSGHLAGLYNQIDRRRGVWKAPAGTEAVLAGVSGLDFDVLDQHQDDLNPRGINALRRVPGAGLVAWAARTRRPDTEYRYIPVRRTAMFLRKSIYNGIQWAVFEPNDEPLWQSLRNTIGAFMETQFRNGAFAGRTSREAYFVKCDATTTTAIDQTAGVVNVLVGFAPLRPAEFVVVRLSQKTTEQN